MANQTIANLVHEENFDSVYQQGENFSMFVANIDESCLLMVIFPSKIGVGVVKYHATEARTDIAAQLQTAQERDPGAGLDLSVMNHGRPERAFQTARMRRLNLRALRPGRDPPTLKSSFTARKSSVSQCAPSQNAPFFECLQPHQATVFASVNSTFCGAKLVPVCAPSQNG